MSRLTLSPFPDFATASKSALELLQSQLGMGLWMITRTAGDAWIMLETANREPQYAVHTGDVFKWSDSFCSRMAVGDGPQVAPAAMEIANYREAPIAKQLPIGAYIGVPLRTAEGELFGTLCAIDPKPQDLAPSSPLLSVVGQLLSTVLDRELKLTAEARRTELAEAAAMRDVLTGLWNRRAWDHFLEREDARCRRYGNPACVLSIDLDGLKQANDTQGHAAGDALLQRAAKAMSAGLREQDIVARVGGDEFAILLVECLEAPGRAIEARLRQQLAAAKVEASIGLAPREPQGDLLRALSRADELMYREKRARKG